MSLEATGNTDTDISNIIDELNNQSNSDSISNVLAINAIGTANFEVPAEEGITTTFTFTHNLGYAPAFLVTGLANDQGLLLLPLIPEAGTYYYSSGSQSLGVYPYIKANAKADSINLYIYLTCFTNPGPFVPEAGIYTFYYFLFSRPINSA